VKTPFARKILYLDSIHFGKFSVNDFADQRRRKIACGL
jgi:hypothetical protein